MKTNTYALKFLSLSALLLPLGTGLICEAKVSKAESTLIHKIARDGMLEVELGKIAEENASGERVKKFGKHMVADHSKANDELKEAARKDGVELPTGLLPEQQKTIELFKALNGKSFDAKYMSEMVNAHNKAVEALTKEFNTGSGNLKAWAGETLPTIKEHDKEAKTIESKVAHSGSEN